jgi:hypothetical protein
VDKENVVYIHNAVLSRHKEEQNYVICRKMDRTRDHHDKQNKADSEKQVLHAFFPMPNLDLEKS